MEECKEREKKERDEEEKRLAKELLERQLRPRRRKRKPREQFEDEEKPTVMQRIRAIQRCIGVVFVIVVVLAVSVLLYTIVY